MERKTIIPIVRMGLLFALAAPCLLAVGALAQEATLSVAPQLSPNAIEKRIRLVDTAGLPDQEREALLEHYKRALAQLNQAAEMEAKAAEYEQARKSAPERLAALRVEMGKEPEPVQIKAPDEPVAELQRYQAEAEAQLSAAKKQADDLDAENARRSQRRAEIPTLRADAEEDLAQIRRQLGLLDQQTPSRGEDVSRLESVAQKTALLASQKALEATLNAIEQEMLSYDARAALLTARRTKAARNLSRAQQRLEQWRKIVQERRRQEARDAASQTQETASTVHPQLQEIAEGNKQLAERRADLLASKLEPAVSRLRLIKEQVEALKSDLEKTRERISKGRMTKGLSLLLRSKRSELPDVRQHKRRIHARQGEIADVRSEMFDLDDLQSEWMDTERKVTEQMRQLDARLSAEEREDLKPKVEKLARTRLKLLQALRDDYETYFDTLVELDSQERALVGAAQGYTNFVDERVLWFRSSAPLRISDIRRATVALSKLVGSTNWDAALKSLLNDLWRLAPYYALAALVFAALLFVRPRCKRALLRTGELVRSVRTDSMRHSLQALGYTLLLALPWPGLLGFVGWNLSRATQAPDFVKAVGIGAECAALAFFTISLVCAFCIKGGMFEAHFRWPARTARAVRANASWLLFFVAPVVFLVSMLAWLGLDAQKDTLGRVAFMVGYVAVLVFVHRILRLRDGALQEVFERRRGGWLERLRWLWYAVGIAVPLALIAGAAAGYYYTVLVLSWRLVITAWGILGLFLGYEFLLRWLFFVQRRLAVQRAEQQRSEAATGRHEDAADSQLLPPEEPEVTIYSISARSRRLLGSFFVFASLLALLLVWKDVVPALGVIGNIKLEKNLPITLGGVVLALFFLVMTAFAAKNVPALLEMVALEYLPLEAGLRFAFTRICRYAIILIGVLLAAGAINIQWNHVQWLVAALTVGLGFGLQDIFGNFVSGVIILLERPLRVGDTVTVGDVTGTVSKIRIRATTITDWDRKELVVPNREFITGRLINWSLSDKILRVIVPVGIAYGSDTEKVRDILLRVAEDCDSVLEEPSPSAFFLAFGDSALQFELRAYVESIDYFLKARHELHMGIDKALREAGIEIAFPQADVHIRSVPKELPTIERGENPARS